VNEREADEQLVERFEADGFVALPGFLSESEVAELQSNVSRFIRDVAPAMPRAEVFFEDKRDPATLKQLQRMFEYDAYFHQLTFGSRFERLAATLLRHEVRGVNMQYFNKPPEIGKPTPAHQDGYYFMLEPNEAVTMWLALDEVDEENGCVRYIRGSHRQGLRPHGQTDTIGFSQGLLDYTDEERRNEVFFPAKPGDLLVHHALTVHRADGNNSHNRTRKALGFIYYSTAAKEHRDKQKYQAELAQRLKSEGKI